MSGATAEQHLAMQRNFAPGTPGARGDRMDRRNLFGSVFNTLLTLAVVGFAALVLPPLFRWGVTQASFLGHTRADCTGDGACWTFIRVRLPLFFYGRYPSSEYWRVDLAGILLVAFCVPVLREQVRHRWLWLLLLLTLFPALASVLLWGGVLGLDYVDTTLWGGLMLDIIISFVAVAGSLPLGILLALGPAVAVADRARTFGRLYRVVARRAAADRAVHVGGADADVPAARRVDRSFAARHGGPGAVQCRLHGGGRPRRPARRRCRPGRGRRIRSACAGGRCRPSSCCRRRCASWCRASSIR